jgi:hypothetical protein
VDVSIASKYGIDLAQLTRVLAEDIHHTLDSFRHDLDDNLPRQIRSVVKEVVGNVQGKQTADTANIANSHTSLPNEGFHSNQAVNTNLQHSYYQATAYGPHFPSGSTGMPHGSWPDARVPNMQYVLNTDKGVSGELSEGVK